MSKDLIQDRVQRFSPPLFQDEPEQFQNKGEISVWLSDRDKENVPQQT